MFRSGLLGGVWPHWKADLAPLRIRVLVKEQNGVADYADQFGASGLRHLLGQFAAVVRAAREPDLNQFVFVQNPCEFGEKGGVDSVFADVDCRAQGLSNPAEERFLKALHAKVWATLGVREVLIQRKARMDLDSLKREAAVQALTSVVRARLLGAVGDVEANKSVRRIAINRAAVNDLLKRIPRRSDGEHIESVWTGLPVLQIRRELRGA